MNTKLLLIIIFFLVCNAAFAQSKKPNMKSGAAANEEIKYGPEVNYPDSLLTVNLPDVQITYFKTKEEWMQYYKYKSRIIKVMPYVKIAKQLHAELTDNKENNKKKEYRKYRKDVEKEMRAKFEKELKNLNQGQGEMLFKLINRETGNNSFNLIKDIKGGFQAGILQLMAKHWGYNLKDKYDPNQEKMIELIIKELGPTYNVN